MNYRLNDNENQKEKIGKWEKNKKKNQLSIIDTDEILVLIIGVITFIYLSAYRITFIMLVILWYWMKIRFHEREIIKKQNEIYNIDYIRQEKEEGMPVNQTVHEKFVEIERRPMKHDLKQLENKRGFLVDKFIILNLILVILIELFINNS